MDVTELTDADLAVLRDEVRDELTRREALASLDVLATIRQAAANLSATVVTAEYGAEFLLSAPTLAEYLDQAFRSTMPEAALLIVQTRAEWRLLIDKLRLIAAGVPS